MYKTFKVINMKFTNINRKLIPIVLLSALIGMSSCQDFLEQPTDSITTLDSVFANPDNAMFAFYNAYNVSLTWNRGLRQYPNTGNQLAYGYPLNPTGGTLFGNGGNAQTMFYSDEASQELLSGNTAILFIFGNWGPSGNYQREFPTVGVMSAIRACNIFIENAPNVPLMTTPKWVWNEAFRNQVIAEVRILRAFLHFENFRRFGGMPILDKVSKFEETPGQLVVTPSSERRSLKSTIDFVVKECEEAMPYLKQPEEFSNAETGRIHFGVALALKARALLYAASPLYNETSAELPERCENGRDSLLCYGNFDANRWKLAADAYQLAIDWAESKGKVLLDDPTLGKTDSYVLGSESPRALSPKNNESIYYISHGPDDLDARTYRTGGPLLFAGGWGTIAGAGFKFIKDNYRDVNGNPLNIPETGTFSELKSIFRKAEPRFHASIWMPGFKYSTIDQTSQITKFGTADTALFKYRSLTNELKDASSSTVVIQTEQPGFFYTKKWRQIYTSSPYFVTWTEFRLSEFYLSYAEAMNEFNPNDPQILYYLNKLRVRGGIPEIQTSDQRFGNKESMRAEIRRERAVELYGDEHRYFDVRRWKIADQTMGGDWYKVVLYQNSATAYVNPTTSMTPAQRLANDATISYRFEKLSTHVWAPKMYFYPFYQPEVDKGVIVQNPGW